VAELFLLALSVCIFTMFIIVSILLIVERKYNRSMSDQQFEELDTGDAMKISAVFIAGITAEILLGWVIMELPFTLIQALIAGLLLGAVSSAILFPIIRMIYRKKTKERADY